MPIDRNEISDYVRRKRKWKNIRAKIDSLELWYSVASCLILFVFSFNAPSPTLKYILLFFGCGVFLGIIKQLVECYIEGGKE